MVPETIALSVVALSVCQGDGIMIQCPHCHWIIRDDATLEHDLIKLCDGEVVLYKRKDSDKWQARFLTPNRTWQRISTKRVRIDDAKVVACEEYDRARFRDDEGLIAVSRRFRDVAKLAIHRMELETASGRGNSFWLSSH